jgi:putative membrane protein
MFGVVGAVGTVAAAATAAAMVATPLLPQGGRGRRILSSVVVGGFFVATTANSIRRWGATRSASAAGVTALSTALVEQLGVRTGIPFGRYTYTSALQPQLAHVPVIVPMAWFGMGVPSREVAHAALGPASTPVRRIALGAAAVTAWDLFLDPQMVGEGFWRWTRTGAYRGIPLLNFAGWFVTGLGIMTALEILLPPDDADTALVGEYTFMGVMETIGFARYFRDPLVAAVGGTAMLPIAAVAVVNTLRRGT